MQTKEQDNCLQYAERKKRMEHYISAEMIGLFEQKLKNEEKSSATVDKYLRDLRAFLHFIQNKKQVTKEIVIAYKEKIMASYAVSSVNSMLAALNCFFKENDWYDCVVKTIKVQQEAFRPVERELKKQEYYSLLKAAEAKGNERLSLVMQTICATGIRVSELKFITVESLCCGRASVSLKGKTRIVLLPADLCRKLKKYVKEKKITHGSVFITRNGNPLDRSNILHDMKALCGAAGVDPRKVFPHNLRHLFAVTYYQVEKDLTRLADILGHSNVNTTRIYTMVNGEEQARKINLLGLVL